MRSGCGSERSVRAAAALGSVALVIGTGACVSKQTTGWSCNFERPGPVAWLGQADAASPDAGAVTEDAGADLGDAPNEHGCVDGSVCPRGTVLFMATYSASCEERTIVCRRPRPGLPAKPRAPRDPDDVWGDSVWLSGDLTREDVEAIMSAVARVDAQPPHSIRQRGDVAEVTMECVGACIIGVGWGYALRKVDGAWTIVKRLPAQIE